MPSTPPRSIYLDHSATTPVSTLALETMLPYFSEHFGNASGIYRQGRIAKQALEEARSTVAAVLNASPAEIVFTSCGSESDNMALRGAAWQARQTNNGNHIITSAVEHKAVITTAQQLAELHGFDLTILPVDGYGRVDPDDLRNAIRPDTFLVSILTANNEVGTIQPIPALTAIAREHGIPFHTDAVQAPGHLSLDVEALGVDALALSGHKFYGPKGVGVAYLRDGLALVGMQTGGGHEGKRRAGTENVVGIVGLATALHQAEGLRSQEAPRLMALRDRLLEEIPNLIPDTRISGHPLRTPAPSRQLPVQRHRNPGRAHGAGHGGHCRQQRFGLHQRRPGPFQHPHSHGRQRLRRHRAFAPDPGPQHHR